MARRSDDFFTPDFFRTGSVWPKLTVSRNQLGPGLVWHSMIFLVCHKWLAVLKWHSGEGKKKKKKKKKESSRVVRAGNQLGMQRFCHKLPDTRPLDDETIIA